MAQQNINYGAFPNDPAANTIRDAFIVAQNNFTQLFSAANAESNVSSIIAGTGISIAPANGVGNVTVTSTFNSLRVRSNTISVSSLGGIVDGNTIVIPDASATLILELNSNTNANSSLFNLDVAGNLTVSGNSISAGTANINLANGNITLTNGRLAGKVQALGGSGAIQYSDANGNMSGTSVFYFDTTLNKLTVPAMAATQILGGACNITDGVFSNLSSNVVAANTITVAGNISANHAVISNSVTAMTFSGNLAGNVRANALANSVMFFGTSGLSTGSSNFTYNGTNLTLSNGTFVCSAITGNLTGIASLATSVIGAVQPNIAEVGNLNFLNVFGNAIVNHFTSNSNVIGVDASFVSASVSNTLTVTNINSTRANLQLDLIAQNVNANATVNAVNINSVSGIFSNTVTSNSVVFSQQASPPLAPAPGAVYYNGATGKLQVYNGLLSVWQDLN